MKTDYQDKDLLEGLHNEQSEQSEQGELANRNTEFDNVLDKGQMIWEQTNVK